MGDPGRARGCQGSGCKPDGVYQPGGIEGFRRLRPEPLKQGLEGEKPCFKEYYVTVMAISFALAYWIQKSEPGFQIMF